MTPVRYLALDVGDRRIGLAVGDDALGLARPLPTVRRRSVERDLAALREIVAREGVEGLVIGLPLTLRGEDGPQAVRVRRFAEACADLGLPLELYDERFTTAEAIGRGAPDVDAGAATVLLEDFFAARR
ncbi:MAG TPA: Holliday junction resolvase RuvX [Candidatus Limnocylindrales bacterium]|nr:Holliday junction resolvase RuvX [Candidatus Limnocylindrales bacterium]